MPASSGIGAATARALAAQSLAVQVFERAGQVAAGASGNAAGLYTRPALLGLLCPG